MGEGKDLTEVIRRLEISEQIPVSKDATRPGSHPGPMLASASSTFFLTTSASRSRTSICSRFPAQADTSAKSLRLRRHLSQSIVNGDPRQTLRLFRTLLFEVFNRASRNENGCGGMVQSLNDVLGELIRDIDSSEVRRRLPTVEPIAPQRLQFLERGDFGLCRPLRIAQLFHLDSKLRAARASHPPASVRP